MAKKGGLFGKLLGVAAIAGAAKVISDLEKKAKNEGVDILDVAKEKVEDVVADVATGELEENIAEKVNDIVEDVKSGELEKNITEKVNDIVEDVKTGEFAKNIADKVSDIVEDIQTDEFKDKATETFNNLKDGVVDIFDGKNNPEQ